jgi:hypothetical protein
LKNRQTIDMTINISHLVIVLFLIENACLNRVSGISIDVAKSFSRFDPYLSGFEMREKEWKKQEARKKLDELKQKKDQEAFSRVVHEYLMSKSTGNSILMDFYSGRYK